MVLTHNILAVNGNTVTVQFVNESNQSYVKNLMISSELNGNTDDPEFLNTIEQHKRVIINRANLGMIEFV